MEGTGRMEFAMLWREDGERRTRQEEQWAGAVLIGSSQRCLAGLDSTDQLKLGQAVRSRAKSNDKATLF